MILRKPSDILVLGFSPETKFRVLFADVTEAVHAISDMQGCTPVSEYLLGGALVSTVLMGADLTRPGETLSARIECDGPAAGSYTEYAAGGAVRGYTRRKLLEGNESDPAQDLDALFGPELRVQAYLTRPGPEPDAKSLFRAAPPTFRNVVESFFLSSFHIPTWASVGLRMDSAGLGRAIGFAVQCMPDGNMAAFVEKADLFTSDETIGRLLDDPALETSREIFDLPDLAVGRTETLAFHCACSRERSRAMLLGLPEQDLREMAATDSVQTVTCHFCGSTYEYTQDDLREILAEKTKKA